MKLDIIVDDCGSVPVSRTEDDIIGLFVDENVLTSSDIAPFGIHEECGLDIRRACLELHGTYCTLQYMVLEEGNSGLCIAWVPDLGENSVRNLLKSVVRRRNNLINGCQRCPQKRRDLTHGNTIVAGEL